jgi:hypothetical protein
VSANNQLHRIRSLCSLSCELGRYVSKVFEGFSVKKDESSSIRNQAVEAIRDAAESRRDTAESKRDSAEKMRVSAEDNRRLKDEIREIAENLRQEKESVRQIAEIARAEKEGLRASSEEARKVNEELRQSVAEAQLVWKRMYEIQKNTLQQRIESQEMMDAAKKMMDETLMMRNKSKTIGDA